MTELLEPVFGALRPLTSPFLALAVTLLLPVLRRMPTRRALVLGLVAMGAMFAGYHALVAYPRASRWLAASESPFAAAYLVIILPALLLPRRGWYRLHLIVPAACVAFLAVGVYDGYRSVPAGEEGFYWLLVRPVWVAVGVASALVLVRGLFSLPTFRKVVRISCALVLLYGGFALRADYQDYQAMRERRAEASDDVMTISETSPVMRTDRRLSFLLSAPCRFSADGGYVQGCNMELLQRLMQIDGTKLAERDPGALAALEMGLGAGAFLVIFAFITARWTCGWLCPLSALGDLFDRGRRLVGAPHLKPAQPVKLAYLFSGAGLAAIGLAMARAVPHLDAEGKFAGCKIPLYPFCKICPGNQVCPVAAGGPGEWPGLPGWEWALGYFRVGVAVVLGVFLVSFMVGRRLWCRLCPMGMLAGLFSRGGATRLRKDATKCNQCGACAEVCPMDIDRVRAEMSDADVSSYDCVLCLQCVASCPRDECLSVEHGGARIASSRYAP